MRNLKLCIAYEGTSFLGWQKTKMGPSIEETLGAAAEQILRHPVRLQAASRTDAGVHAVGQVVNCVSDSTIDLKDLQRGLNAVLPSTISVRSIKEMPVSFHPTLDCIGKEYHYSICYGPVQLPFHRLFSWHFPHRLNFEWIEEAASVLIGTHDFSAFTSEPQENNVRHLKEIQLIYLEGSRLKISFLGTNFLYKMVRTLVGTLLYIGCQKIDKGAIETILKSRQRPLAGVTAPAHGLCLEKVYYAQSE